MRDLSWQTIFPVFDGYRVSAGPAQAAIQAVLNDLEALKASKDLEATCHGHKIWGVNPISIDRPSFAFRCFRLDWLLVEQTWQLGSNPNWSAIVISSTWKTRCPIKIVPYATVSCFHVRNLPLRLEALFTLHCG